MGDDMYRNTYAKINLSNIYDNILNIKNKYDYEYYIAVVKANCYGHGLRAIEPMIKAGCNYLAVATLDEAVEVRKLYPTIPILCLGIVYKKDLSICLENNITITINSKEYFNDIKDLNLPLKVHLKLNTGMNRLGIKDINDVNICLQNIEESNFILEGLYTHMFNPNSEFDTNRQIDKFNKLCENIDLSKIKIIHIAASDTLTKYPKPKYVNGARLGIIMYGFNDSIELKSTFSLHSTIAQINNISIDEKVGYNGLYSPNKNEKIGVVQIGYADGIIRAYTGNNVFINDREYPIVGNVCMDMLFVQTDEFVNVYQEVTLLKDNQHIINTANHLKTIPYEILCSISNRVPRIYVD